MDPHKLPHLWITRFEQFAEEALAHSKHSAEESTAEASSVHRLTAETVDDLIGQSRIGDNEK